MTATTGAAVVDFLRRQGVRRVFCVPGESYLPILDAAAAEEQIELVTCRHEGAAAFMAEATGRMTGIPGVCLVTRGPGATNASIGVHAALQASSPMLLVVGQVPTTVLGRSAFQEVDLAAMFAPLAKAVIELTSVARTEELLAQAWALATEGRPGPVVIVAPVDVLFEPWIPPSAPPPRPSIRLEPSFEVERVMELVARSAAPLVVVGGPHWSDMAARDLQRWAESNALPVAVDLRCQDFIDNSSPSYVGELGVDANPALVARLASADLIVAIGTSLGDVPTRGYTAVRPPYPEQTIVHVGPDSRRMGAVVRPALGIVAPAPGVVGALARAPAADAPWAERSRELRASYLEWSLPGPPGEDLDLASVVAGIRARVPRDTVVTSGAGNYTAWTQRYWSFSQFGTQLAPSSGVMGYGLPAAIAAALEDRGRRAVCFAGDGCFGMTLVELATAVHHGVGPLVVVVNNNRYGTIAMHQERRFPGRPAGTDLTNPDFVALARSFGAQATLAESTADALAACDSWLEVPAELALIELRTDPSVLLPA